MAGQQIIQTATMGFRDQIITLRERCEVGKDGQRTYDDLTLRPYELVADGVDEIGIIFFVHNEAAKDPQEIAADYAIKSLSFTFSHDSQYLFEFTEDNTFQQPGAKRFTLKTFHALAYAQNAAELITIDAVAELEATKSEKKEPLTRKRSVTFSPCYLYSKLWVIPGKMRHTSEAGACVGLRLPRPPYFTPKSNMLASLVITNPGGEPEMYSVDAAGAESSLDDTPVKNGLVKWTVRYRGMTIDNVSGASFALQVRLPNMAKMATVRFHVGNNIVALLADLEQRNTDVDHVSRNLDLTNPEFQSNMLTDHVLHEQTLGICYNMRLFIADKVGYPAPPEWKKYVCGEYAIRILRWLHERRLGFGHYTFDTAQQMNGIEFAEFALAGLHDFAGFNLSGNGPWTGAQMIDPWWTQSYRDRDGDFVLLTLRSELIRLPMAITLLITEAVPFVYFLGPPLVNFILGVVTIVGEAAVGAAGAVMSGAVVPVANYVSGTGAGTYFAALGPRAIAAVLGFVRAAIVDRIRNAAFNPKHTMTVFGALGAVAGFVFGKTLLCNTEFFEDDPDLMSYARFSDTWLRTQTDKWLSEHRGGESLPYMD